MLVSAPTEDLARACVALLERSPAPRDVEEIAADLRNRGWTLQNEHLRQILERSEHFFTKIGDRFTLAPKIEEPPVRPVTWTDIHTRMVRKFSAAWWRVIAVRAAFPPALQEPQTTLAQSINTERRARTYRLAKIHDDRYAMMMCWVGGVGPIRRESLRSWACWKIEDLESWQFGIDPVQPRFMGCASSELVVTQPANSANTAADVLISALQSSGARPQDVWLEPVPVDGLEIEHRSHQLAEAKLPWQPPNAGRRAAPDVCVWCGGELTTREDHGRGADAACWAGNETFESQVVRFTRSEWVGAMDLAQWKTLVADPPRGQGAALRGARVTDPHLD